MLDKNFYCVLMAGGFGDKLWPWSREDKPKQFIPFSTIEKSMVRMAYEQCLQVVPAENVLVITLEKFQDRVREAIPEIPSTNILLEPVGRHTAPCTVYSTYTILKRNPNAVIAMITVDHIIKETALFCSTLEKAMVESSKRDALMVLGVIPSRPDTNYGYIQAMGGKAARNSHVPVPVKTFTEKPELPVAEAFVRSGEFFWNSGIFIAKASVLREECEAYMPEITSLFAGWEDNLGTPSENVFIQKVYSDSPKLSIDYGVMEKTSRAWIYPVSFKWTDVDSWEVIYSNVSGKDSEGIFCNAVHKILKDNDNSLFLTSNKEKLVAIRGLKDYVVIDTDDVLLICPKESEAYNDLTSSIGLSDYEKYR